MLPDGAAEAARALWRRLQAATEPVVLRGHVAAAATAVAVNNNNATWPLHAWSLDALAASADGAIPVRTRWHRRDGAMPPRRELETEGVHVVLPLARACAAARDPVAASADVRELAGWGDAPRTVYVSYQYLGDVFGADSERVRALGPTIHPDMGKQTEGGAVIEAIAHAAGAARSAGRARLIRR